ncbi:MAG: DUF211 domain-containing protein [Fervidicoccaceae archaeon]
MPLRKLVLDVLKPLRGLGIEEMALALESLEGVEKVEIVVKEFDVDTVTLIVTLEGEAIDFESVKESLEKLGAVIHGVDQVIAARSTERSRRHRSE